MIRYTLACDQGHAFESWFQSADAFDRLAAAGSLACALCGTSKVAKALMAPAVSQGGVAPPAPEQAGPADRPLSAPMSAAERAIADLRHRLETESENVGLSFATEARAMHDGTIPERPIWGEAKPDEARALIEDGVPVMPLPFLSRRRSN